MPPSQQYSEKPISQLIVERHLKDSEALLKEAVEGCVMFVDLVGSTDFKQNHSPGEGLAKAHLHNLVVTQQILKCGGRVVKYIGDAVMGFFEGDAASSALSCAISIV